MERKEKADGFGLVKPWSLHRQRQVCWDEIEGGLETKETQALG